MLCAAIPQLATEHSGRRSWSANSLKPTMSSAEDLSGFGVRAGTREAVISAQGGNGTRPVQTRRDTTRSDATRLYREPPSRHRAGSHPPSIVAGLNG